MKTLTNVHVLKPCDVIDANRIKQMAESYQPNEGNEAPVVIGHPKDNHPAYGWVKSLTEQAGHLYANLEVQDSLYDMLKRKLFKNRSVSYYDSNPPTFRHLGFLGAKPPHVKGLQALNLSEPDSETEIVTLSDDSHLDLDSKEPELPMKDLKPSVLYCLSEILPGITARSFKTEPTQDSAGLISGIISLDETDYSYTMLDDGNGNWDVETAISNQETVDLSERVKTLEAQLARNEISGQVKDLHTAKLSPAIISLSDLTDLVVQAPKVLELLQKLPDIVDMSEAVPEKAPEPEESAIEFAKRLTAGM